MASLNASGKLVIRTLIAIALVYGVYQAVLRYVSLTEPIIKEPLITTGEGLNVIFILVIAFLIRSLLGPLAVIVSRALPIHYTTAVSVVDKVLWLVILVIVYSELGGLLVKLLSVVLPHRTAYAAVDIGSIIIGALLIYGIVKDLTSP